MVKQQFEAMRDPQAGVVLPRLLARGCSEPQIARAADQLRSRWSLKTNQAAKK